MNTLLEPKLILKTDRPNCYHCGEFCADQVHSVDEKHFCCPGCQLVYELLHEHQLEHFYLHRDGQSGRQLESEKDQFAALDEITVRDQLLEFREGSLAKIRLSLPQIHCSACIWLLEKLYKINPGIHSSRVNFLRKEAYITFDLEQISLRKLAELLASIGYAPELNLSNLNQETKAPKDWKLFYQLGVAGFAFGNSMLLSFPEYLGLDHSSETIFRSTFGYINLALALPVVLYSAQDYWRAAKANLLSRELTIDVPITLGIFTLLFRSTWEIIGQTGAGYLDSLTGLVFFLLFGKWFQQKTYHHLSFERDYQAYFPISVRLLDGATKMVTNLAIGDIILIRNGELLPADGFLLKGAAQMDYSFVTGEALPVQKQGGDQLFAGGRQMGGQIQVQINRPISQSYLTRLWDQETFQKDKEKQHILTTNKVGKYFTITILGIALASLLFWLDQEEISTAINVFTAVLIIACPCAIALSVPFTLGSALRLLGKSGLFLKNTNVIERMPTINCIVFDKTGTLTESQQNLGIDYDGRPLSDKEKRALFTLCQQSNHPIAQAVGQWSQENSDLTIEGFLESTGKGISGKIEQHQFELGSADYLDVEPLLAASGNVFLRIDHQLAGSFTVHNRYRSNFSELINQLKAKYELHLLSGDNERESQFLSNYFPGKHLHFKQSPQAKLEFIKSLQQEGKKVMMVGDGLNDAGALQQSEVGMVIAENTNNFTPASDAILEARRFPQISQLLTYASQSNRLVIYAYVLAIIYNIIGLSFAVQGLLSPVIAAILMPLSSITIVAFGVLSTRVLTTRYLVFNDSR